MNIFKKAFDFLTSIGTTILGAFLGGFFGLFGANPKMGDPLLPTGGIKVPPPRQIMDRRGIKPTALEQRVRPHRERAKPAQPQYSGAASANVPPAVSGSEPSLQERAFMHFWNRDCWGLLFSRDQAKAIQGNAPSMLESLQEAANRAGNGEQKNVIVTAKDWGPNATAREYMSQGRRPERRNSM